MGYKDDNYSTKVCGHHPETCTCRDWDTKEEPKQETLEEAAYQARRNYQDEVGKDGMNECIMLDAMKIQRGFELGAKWQAERMYIEADKIMKFLDTEVELKLSDIKTIERIKWYFETYFEQFKKK